MKHFITFLFFILLTSTLYSQGQGGIDQHKTKDPQQGGQKGPVMFRDISGIVKDTAGNQIEGAGVKLISAADSAITTADANGKFVFKHIKSATFVITVISIGYETIVKRMRNNDELPILNLEPFILKAQSNMLNEVVIKGCAGYNL